MRGVFRAIALMLTAVSASCTGGDSENGAPHQSLAVLAQTETFTLESAVTGRTYQIYVALPRGYEDSDSLYPVLYSVDANSQFGTIVDVARAMLVEGLPEPLLIGIGYPVGHPWNAMSPRAVDLTPTADPETVAQDARDYPEYPPMEGSGGGPEFLQFIRQELIPYVEANYKASPDGRALYGHSFGGLFGTYALFAGEGTFSRFVIGSPSYWWDDRESFEMEAEFSESHDSLPAKVFFAVGLLEEVPGEEDAQYRMVSNLQEFLEVLQGRGYQGLTLASEFFPGENHTSVIPVTISRGVRFVFSN